MQLWPELEPWWRFGAALVIGALIGLEREFVQQRSGEREFGGIRTFALLSLGGAAAAYFTERYGIALFIAVYVSLVLMILASHLGEMVRGEEEGITTEVIGALMPLLGAMVIWDRVELAAALGVTAAFLLSLRPRLHGLARGMSEEDMRATLEFALITAVILPLLPNRGLGPYGVLNPFQIWLLVVLVSGIGFFGYLLMKVLGAERGIGLTGLLGGLVSSTATTLSFAGRSQQQSGLSALFTRGILLASAVMFIRLLVWVIAVHRPLLALVAVPIVTMLVLDLAMVIYLWRRGHASRDGERQQVELTNPLKIRTAIGFGLAFAVVIVAVRAANEFFGSAGVYIASSLAAITDVDSITLSTAQLASRGQLDLHVAAGAITLAALVNTAAKGVMAWSLGSAGLRRALARAFGLILLGGAVSGGLVLFGVF